MPTKWMRLTACFILRPPSSTCASSASAKPQVDDAGAPPPACRRS